MKLNNLAVAFVLGLFVHLGQSEEAAAPAGASTGDKKENTALPGDQEPTADGKKLPVSPPSRPYGATFDLELSRNRENWDSIGQNGFMLFRLRPYYRFDNKWSISPLFEGRQQVKPQKVWRWIDATLYVSSPAYDLGSDLYLRFTPTFTYPLSKFSRDALEMRFGLGLSSEVGWKVSQSETWALNRLAYSLGVNKKFYRFSTDIAGEPVTEWLITHTVRGVFSLFKKLSFDAKFYLDSEFHSSHKIFNSIALEGELAYEWSPWLSTYLNVSNSGDALRTQQNLARLGTFGERETQLSMGVSFTY